MIKKEFLGLDCIEFSFGEIVILVTQSVGPRILSLKFRNSDNLFAQLPGEYLSYGNKKKFFFYGGHRLWVAPEIPTITYSSDEAPITIKEENEPISLIQDKDLNTGLQKELRILKSDLENTIIVDHILKNICEKPKTVAPWAITQFKLGGFAILPLNETDGNSNPFIPNRSIVLWPYTDVYDPRIKIENKLLFVMSTPARNALKIGIPNRQNWIGYVFEDALFIKYSKNFNKICKLDLGAAAQCYCNNKFIELETLGNLVTLNPGRVIKHREIWHLLKAPFNSISVDVPVELHAIHQLMEDHKKLL